MRISLPPSKKEAISSYILGGHHKDGSKSMLSGSGYPSASHHFSTTHSSKQLSESITRRTMKIELSETDKLKKKLDEDQFFAEFHHHMENIDLQRVLNEEQNKNTNDKNKVEDTRGDVASSIDHEEKSEPLAHRANVEPKVDFKLSKDELEFKLKDFLSGDEVSQALRYESDNESLHEEKEDKGLIAKEDDKEYNGEIVKQIHEKFSKEHQREVLEEQIKEKKLRDKKEYEDNLKLEREIVNRDRKIAIEKMIQNNEDMIKKQLDIRKMIDESLSQARKKKLEMDALDKEDELRALRYQEMLEMRRRENEERIEQARKRKEELSKISSTLDASQDVSVHSKMSSTSSLLNSPFDDGEGEEEKRQEIKKEKIEKKKEQHFNENENLLKFLYSGNNDEEEVKDDVVVSSSLSTTKIEINTKKDEPKTAIDEKSQTKLKEIYILKEAARRLLLDNEQRYHRIKPIIEEILREEEEKLKMN